MNRLVLPSLGALASVSALSGWACSTAPHFVSSASNLDPNLVDAPADGCLELSPVPVNYQCP